MQNEMNFNKMSNEEIINILRSTLAGDFKNFEAVYEAIPKERRGEIQRILTESLFATCKEKGIKLTITEDTNGESITKSNF